MCESIAAALPSAVWVGGRVCSRWQRVALRIVLRVWREAGQHEHPRLGVRVEGAEAREHLLEEHLLVRRLVTVWEVLCVHHRVIPMSGYVCPQLAGQALPGLAK
eukprot:2627222-Prymnesium_polylepis.2